MARRDSQLRTSKTHAEIASAIGKERSYVSKLLGGTRPAPLGLALQIFDFAGISVGPLKGKSATEIGELRKAHATLQQVVA